MYNNTFNRSAPAMGRLKKLLLLINSVISSVNKVERRKWIMRINITTILLIIVLAQVSAKGFGQKITLNTDQMPVEKILQSIRDQSGYRVFYDSKDLKDQKITLQLKDVPVQEAIKVLANHLQLDYKIVKNTIVLTKTDPSLLDKFIARFQAIDVRGKVLDEKAEPLAGATVAIKGGGKSVKTNAKGEFYLQNVDEKDKLVISYVGYQTREVSATADLGNITMVLEDAKLEEVTVNAGYYTVKDSERTGSIARITSKDIETQPVTNFLATMQGRMAGVSIVQSTGIPGGSFDIKIRGQNSLRAEGNSPLYIIDGVPYSSDVIGHVQVSSSLFPFPYAGSPLNSINPDQIESIEVLKDADATAIYGSRGANGVVLITTKKGQTGKTTFNLNVTRGVGKATRFAELMNTEQYIKMRKQAFINDGVQTYPASAYDINGTWDQTRYTNWQKELLGGTSVQNDFQGSVSGGSKNTSFLFSGNYHTQSTVFPGKFLYKKGGSKFNMNHTSEDQKFKVQLSVGYTLQDNDQPSTDFTYNARYLAPNAPALYDENGKLNWAGNTWLNPLRMLLAKYESNTNDFLGNTLLSYELIPGLVIKSSFGYTDLRHKETRINPSTIYNPILNIGSASSSLSLNNTARNSWIIEPQINWEKELFDGRLSLLFGGTFQSQTSTQLVQTGSGFSSNSLIYNIAAATTVRALNDDAIRYKYQAFFSRLNYNWKERYILNLTARRDGSSRFGPGKQFATFGAAGAAWLFSKETFFSHMPWLSFGKLRSSYGITGSDQIGDYQFLDTYTTSGKSYNGITGLQPTRLFNPDFAWETNRKLELAMETGFFKDRIFLTTAWYRNRSSNQLVGIPMPGITGFATLNANLNATVENKGWEFTLNTVNLNQGKLNWTSSFNLSISRNKLLRFPGLESSPYKQTYRINQPLNIKLLYDFIGVDTQTGIYQFRDINNDGKISSPEDKQIAVSITPQYFGGLQNQFSYKGLTLDFLLQFVKQKNNNSAIGIIGQMYSVPERAKNGWLQPGDSAPYQKYTAGYNNTAVTAGDRYSQSTAAISDASFIRLKNVALSYDLPLKSKYMKCRLITQGQNLFVLTAYKDGDPEFTSYGSLPPLKIFTAGIQLTF